MSLWSTRIIQGTIITMILCRIGRGKSTHAHAQWYNSLSVGNSLAAVAMPVYGRAPIHSQVYNGTAVSLALYKTFECG